MERFHNNGTVADHKEQGRRSAFADEKRPVSGGSPPVAGRYETSTCLSGFIRGLTSPAPPADAPAARRTPLPAVPALSLPWAAGTLLSNSPAAPAGSAGY